MSIQCFETILIFSDKLTEEEYEEKVRDYKKWFAELPATRMRTEKIGKRKLAYKARGCEYGYYASFTYKSTEDLVHTKLHLMLRKDDDVIKFITVTHDGEYTPDSEENDDSASAKSEQRKKPVDVFDLIFGLESWKGDEINGLSFTNSIKNYD